MINLGPYYVGKAIAHFGSKALRPFFERRFPWARNQRSEPQYKLVDDLLQRGDISLQSYEVDKVRFQEWVAAAGYPALAYVANREEKFLEHQVSVDLLKLNAESRVLIDVASCRSYFPEIMRRHGYRVIAQDLSYPPGLHGDRLGGDAASILVPANFANGVTLHCSFEHFEGNADTLFVRTLGRILAPRARAVILPLYLGERYVIETDPLISQGRVPIDDGAELVASYGYTNRFGRHYDIAALKRRVLDPAADVGLRASVIRINGTKSISSHCYLRYALVLERLK